jgi:hypothetical protein
MFKLCGTFLLGMISCLGLQRVNTAPIDTIPSMPPSPAVIQHATHTEKVVWMQINNHGYTGIALSEAAITLLEKNAKHQ